MTYHRYSREGAHKRKNEPRNPGFLSHPAEIAP